MLGAHSGKRRLAALTGLCLVLALTAAPAALAVPLLQEGDDPASQLAPGPEPVGPAAAQPSSTGIDLVLVAVIGLTAVAIAATTLAVTFSPRRPLPAPRS